MSNVLIVLIIFVLCPAVIFGFILIARYLKYRETLSMIEHGITPPQPPVAPPMMPPMPAPPRPPVVVVNRNQGGAGRGTLIWGLVLSGIGLALTLALWPIGFIANSASGDTVHFPLGLGPWMLVGFTPLFVGLSLILGFVIMRPERGNGPLPPPAHTAPWAPAPGFPAGHSGAGATYPGYGGLGGSGTTAFTDTLPSEAVARPDPTEVGPPSAPTS